MANWGIKVSKRTKSTTSSNLYDYNLWSKYSIGKIAQEGGGTTDTGLSIDYSANAGNDSLWIPYISDDNNNWFIGGVNSGVGYGISDLSVSSFNIVTTGAGTDYYKYFVLVDSSIG